MVGEGVGERGVVVGRGGAVAQLWMWIADMVFVDGLVDGWTRCGWLMLLYWWVRRTMLSLVEAEAVVVVKERGREEDEGGCVELSCCTTSKVSR